MERDDEVAGEGDTVDGDLVVARIDDGVDRCPLAVGLLLADLKLVISALDELLVPGLDLDGDVLHEVCTRVGVLDSKIIIVYALIGDVDVRIGDTVGYDNLGDRGARDELPALVLGVDRDLDEIRAGSLE